MKKIFIKNLKLNNFKGIKKAEYDFSQEEIKIIGDNGTGKTTIIDAFLWLLFNKNSQNATDFSIKPIDKDGNVLHNVDYSVESTFEVIESHGVFYDKKEITLKKVMREKWTKKRGETSPTFTGHETSYFKNDSPKLLKEYQVEVENLCKEDLFRMLTSPFYFNHLDKKVKRDTLLKAVPSISDLSIIEKNIKFYSLIEDLKSSSIEELVAKCKANISSINKNLPSYGFKIEELKNSITTEEEDDDLEGIENTKSLIDHQKRFIDELKTQRDSKTNLAELSAINKEILKLKNSLFEISLNNPLKIKKEKTIEKLKKEIADLHFNLGQIEGDKKIKMIKNHAMEQEIKDLKEKIEDMKKSIDIVYRQCEEIDNLVFSGETTCPTCGQNLPDEQIADAKKLFNLNKSESLQRAIDKGKTLKLVLQELETKLQSRNAELINSNFEEENAKIANFEVQINKKNEELSQELSQEIEDSEEMKELQKKISETEIMKQQLMSSSTASPDLSLKIQEAEDELDSYFSRKARYENNIQFRIRIKELEAEQGSLADNLRSSEEKLILCEEFLKEKVKMIEKQVNDLFSKVNFTMFKEQINGAYEEGFYATIDGVPFDDANNASKINAGLDIIKTLQKVYQIKAPIFIDNAESVTQFEELDDTQTIKLYVTKGAKLEIINNKGE